MQRIITGLVLAAVTTSAFMFSTPLVFVVLLSLLLMYILVVEWPQFSVWWLTPLYPVLPFLALIDVYLTDKYLWAAVVITVTAYDTGAYVCGKFLGTIKIAPQISPGKTVQGLLGGLFFAGFFAYILSVFLLNNVNTSIITICLAGVIIGFLAFLGDLFESYLKRLASVKDSGTLLPGHGGVLDRIDGLLLVMFVVSLLLR